MTDPSRPDSTRRPGFTLVELLVVILILAILIALLVPAIAGAVRTARDGQVSAELNNLATALADFKNTYGDYPPSRIILPTSNTNGGLATIIASPLSSARVYNPGNLPDISVRDLAARSQRYLLKFFPRATSPAAFNVTRAGNYVILEGHECLVFFLGGAPTEDKTTNTWTMTGFSKDPTNPFGGGSNRTRPLYEFPAGRLLDIYSVPITQGGAVFNEFPSLVDPLGTGESDSRPYAYFSGYGGNNYDPNDNNFMGFGTAFPGSSSPIPDSVEQDDSQTGSGIFRTFRVTFPPNAISSYAPNPYTNGDPTGTTVNFINPQTFQIISAGRDRQFGIGGAYVSNSTSSKLPVASSETALEPLRGRERDNITNFSTGKLD
ncbi:MAG: prepilin-type N-terminal cleavage/methylation domain-containing protein [Isosphaeraceae bacterium]|nr:prepilin-type N-terminal cleavage/methylation domain-containing protein [Isosphaeraceae bacterium]